MGESFRVVPDELRGYAGLLQRNAEHFTAIKGYATSEGADTSGFTGVLALLQPAVTGVAHLFGMTLDLAHRKLGEVANALQETASAYEQADQAGKGQAEQIDAARQNVAPAPVAGGGGR
ncbi:MAG TPA: type VII secretion target [Pseudonocardiaceae bacterium]